MATTKPFRQMIIEAQNSAQAKREKERIKWLEETRPIVEGVARGIFLALTNNARIMRDLEGAIIRGAKRSSGVSSQTHSLVLLVNSPTNGDKIDGYITMARDERILAILNKRLAEFVESRKRYAGLRFTISEVNHKARQVDQIDQLVYGVELTVTW
ncbi:MAG TPA: hypothetical protein DEB13_02055 [Candidatus Yanofskybacteria bacterium]|nr:hypothetical protein [Candidatus Yanofskybacteria bacterium]